MDKDTQANDWLRSMYSALNKSRINKDEILELVKSGTQIFDSGRGDYLASVCFPRLTKCRIPRLIAAPSFLTQVHFVYNIVTNANGFASFTFNPCYFAQADNTDNKSTFFFNNNAALDGVTAGNNNYAAVNIGQNTAPAGTFGSHCLASGTIEVSYTGTLDQTKGIIGGGIAVNTQAPYAHPPQNPATVDADSAVFSNFLNVDNLAYAFRTQLINGIKMNYFPVDDKFLFFRQIPVANPVMAANDETYSPYGFAWVVYFANCPPASTIARLDVYLNFELMVQPQMRNFINSDVITAKSRTTLEQTSNFILEPHNRRFIVTDMTSSDNDQVSTFEGFRKLLGGNRESLALLENRII